MANKRDDFTSATKKLLADRVGRRCSNPNCRQLTIGASKRIDKSINIGVAAHICAAAPGGERYDPSMDSEERKSFSNGIWLCQSCSKLIDSDPDYYTVDILRAWKTNAEEETRAELESKPARRLNEEDKKLIQFYIQCFDRPAFQDDIRVEGRMEDFLKAMEDTLIALNTGVLCSRDGRTLKIAEGKSSIQNASWRKRLDLIEDTICLIIRRLKIAEKNHEYSIHGDGVDAMYCFYDYSLMDWFNRKRADILKELSVICKEAGLPEIHFRCRRYRW